MTADGTYRAYREALTAVMDLPRVRQSEIDAVERRNRDAVAVLTRHRQDGARQWTSMRDNSFRLDRRVNDLAVRVGAPQVLTDDTNPIAAERIPDALSSLSAEIDKAEQAWQWVLRHRDRVAQAPSAALVQTPVVQPVAAPIASAPPGKPTSRLNPVALIAVIAVVAVLIVLVIVMLG